MFDVDLVNLAMDEGNEVALLGPVPEGGHFVLAPDRGGDLCIWWAWHQPTGKRRRAPPAVAAEFKAMIEAGCRMREVCADWAKR